MAETTELLTRIRRLEDRAELRELAALYGITIDDHDLRAVAELFTPDASLGSRDGVMGATGREAIIEQFRGRFRALGPSNHFVHDQVLYFDETDPDRATGLVTSHAEVWRNGQAMVASIRYHDSYHRLEGKWRFQTRLLTFFYYLPVEEYATGLGDKLRMRAYGDRRPADFPETLTTWATWEEKF